MADQPVAPPTAEEIEARAKRVESHRLELVRLPVMTEMAKSYGFAEDILRFEDTLIKTVFPAPKEGQRPVSTAQLLMFLNVAREYRLNPFIREIYAFPKDGGIVPIVPIDGWISLVQRQKNYNGHRFEYEWQDGKPGGQMLSAKCIIYRKDTEHPIEHTEYMVECVRDTKVWKQWPRRMLTHKAMIQCARYAFGLTGIYDEDEGERILQADGSDVVNPRPAIQQPQRKTQTLQAPQKSLTPDTFQSPQYRDTQPRQQAQPVQRAQPDVSAQLRDHAVPSQPDTAQDAHDDNYDADPVSQELDRQVDEVKQAIEERQQERQQPQETPEVLKGGKPFIEHLGDVIEGKAEPAELPSRPELTAPLQELFDKGSIKKASDTTPPAEERKAGTIGVGHAKFLHMKAGKGKPRSEVDIKGLLEFLKLEHLRDLPIDKAKAVEEWLNGKDYKHPGE